MGGEARGADVAIWRRSDVPPPSGKYYRTPPILAVEVAGADEDEGEATLREKSRWYFEHGVKHVWLVLPEQREVVVLRPGFEARYGRGQRLPEVPDLPGLSPEVDRFFSQLDPPEGASRA